MGLLLHRFLIQLSSEFLRRLAYGSVVGALLVKLVVSSSGWKAAGSAVAQADLAAAEFIGAVLGDSKPKQQAPVIVLAIDDEAYHGLFQGQSPLDRKRLQQVLQNTLAALPSSTVLVLDLDVSPVLSPANDSRLPDALDAFLVEHKDRFVLVNPHPNATPPSQWLQGMRALGLHFGQADIPQTFGLVDFKHDLGNSLSAVAVRMSCAACLQSLVPTAAGQALTRVSSDPYVLANPTTIALRPDTADVLRAFSPRVVVVGGTWGREDIFQTPFGPRYGVQLHAAKVAGHLEAHRTAPPYAQVLMGVFIAALCVTVARLFAHWLASERGTRQQPGFVLGHSAQGWYLHANPWLHQRQAQPTRAFMAGSWRRFLVMLYCLGVLMGAFLALALVHHVWGLWFPSMFAIGFTAVAVTAAWSTDITRALQIESPVLIVKPLANRTEIAPGAAPAGTPIATEPQTVRAPTYRQQLQQDVAQLRSEFLLPLAHVWRELMGHIRDLRTPSSRPFRQEALSGVWRAVLLLLLRTALPAWAFLSLLY